MKFEALRIPGAFRIYPSRVHDDRGHFARVFCGDEWAAQGLPTRWHQMSVSYNARAGTLRGMHWQRAPHGEHKWVRVTRGAVCDVLLDLRASSPTRLAWQAVELSADNGEAVLIPPGVAHGFLTLCDATEVLYGMDTPFVASAAAGVRWNDPVFGIEWPIAGAPAVISERDAAYPDFDPHARDQDD